MEKKKKLIILGVTILILAISGLTYAILTWTSSKINIGLTSGCFTIDYTKGQDISGNLKLINVGESFDGNDNFVIKEGMGLSYANLGIKSSCTIEGYGSLYLNVTTLSDSFKEGGDSNGALGYALLRNTSNLSNDKLTIENLKGQSFEMIDAKPITNTGTIKLVTEQLSNTELNKYLIVIFVDSVSAGNSITSATFQGNISADAEQGNLPTPDYCFTLSNKDETNKTASLANYNCYSGNSNNYEVITDVKIPEEIDGYKITKINAGFACENYHYISNAGRYVCEGITEISKISIPNTITSIGDSAFEYNKLTTVVIPDSVTSIGVNAFYKNQLVSITLGNSLTSIGVDAFGDNKLTSVTIPDSVTDLSGFSGNQLTSVTIPDSVTTIGTIAFQGNQLTNIAIPDSVTTIGGNAFSYNKLTSVIIPASVVTIEYYAFRYNNLNYVLINSNSKLTSIGTRAFELTNKTGTYNEITYVNNPNLKTIYNNTGKAFDWNNAVNGNSGTTFVTGTTNVRNDGKITYNAVTVTTGQPS